MWTNNEQKVDSWLVYECWVVAIMWMDYIKWKLSCMLLSIVALMPVVIELGTKIYHFIKAPSVWHKEMCSLWQPRGCGFKPRHPSNRKKEEFSLAISLAVLAPYFVDIKMILFFPPYVIAFIILWFRQKMFFWFFFLLLELSSR